MYTKAHYFSDLLKNTFATSSSKNILAFDNIGTINFLPLDNLIPNTIRSQEQINSAIDIYEVTNVAILYTVAQREGKKIGVDGFNGEQIIAALIKHMNIAIENKYEV